MVFMNPTKYHQNPTKDFGDGADKIFNENVSKSHNSVINHQTKTGLHSAQLGIVLINPTKFYRNQTIVLEKSCRQNFLKKYFHFP